MKFSIPSVACILAVTLSGAVQAESEIYQSKDAEGNPVFSDTATAAAEKVVLPQENIADAVTPHPMPAPQAPANPAAVKQPAQHGTVVEIPNSRNERLEQELAADQPHEVLEAAERYEVGDNPTPEEIERRERAKTGEYIDEKGNTVRAEHRGHVGGRR